METLARDLFPADLQRAAITFYGKPAPAAILLKQPPADAIPDCLPTYFGPLPAILHQKEIITLNGYRLPKRRAEFLSGRIAAKMALKRFLASGGQDLLAPLNTVEITNEPNGRPIVCLDARKDWPGPEISITHGGEYAAALAAQSPCGIDIQQQRDNLLRVREKYCSCEELQVLGKLLPEMASLSRLVLLWAAKEAAKKALSYRQMLGFLELELMPPAQRLDRCHSLTLAVRVKNNAQMPDAVTVLATLFADYGLAICILKKEHHA